MIMRKRKQKKEDDDTAELIALGLLKYPWK